MNKREKKIIKRNGKINVRKKYFYSVSTVQKQQRANPPHIRRTYYIYPYYDEAL
jgi:hypothetical protein